ncbi:sulfotransferase [Desulfobotulus sp. H1]|uniref:Sulfotransferase n=1 Tax=Desulfobotulus pelophilus TaxID=2823377 RepID=A0ABT3NDA4_9BACT|nr:sulfotransferase [Desulfobotulus pelophilus]MCW7755441.1 sulfotransferase [Desulfobotulus pelophilus]
MKRNPIFIGGDGRSGTTLLSLILNSHSKLIVGPELHFRGPKNLSSYILGCLKQWELMKGDLLGLKKNEYYKNAVNFIVRCKRFGIDEKILEAMINKVVFLNNYEMIKFEERAVLIDEMSSYLINISHAERWGIKIMKDIKISNKYLEIWPEAQFVHIVRDGRDVAASQMRDHGSWGYKSIEDAAKGWKELIDRSRVTPNGSLLELKYEDLVRYPQKSIHQITDFLNIDWEDRVLYHHEYDHSLYRNSYNHPSINTVINPINQNAIGRYKKDLSLKEIEIFNTMAKSYLLEFGYID